MIFRLSMTIAALMILLSGCNFGGTGGSDPTEPQPPAELLLPNLYGYTTASGQQLAAYLTAAAETAAILSQRPELVAPIKAVDDFADCYRDEGAFRQRIYYKVLDPDSESPNLVAGIASIADRNTLRDPDTFLACLPAALQDASQMRTTLIQPCYGGHVLEQDNNQFFMIYAASNNIVCQDICDRLLGCTENHIAPP